MREIKFRKWAKYANGEMGMVDNDILGGQTLYNLTKRDDDILMQYTGLKDKNGKEIYEGDIIDIDGLIVPVIWHAGAWMVEYLTIPTKSYLFNFDELDITVIGNIYQNPELLTNPELEAYNDVLGNRN